MRWRLRKVRVANIPPGIRDELERAGETVIANALAVPMDVPGSPFHKFRFGEEKTAAEAWHAWATAASASRDPRQAWTPACAGVTRCTEILRRHLAHEVAFADFDAEAAENVARRSRMEIKIRHGKVI